MKILTLNTWQERGPWRERWDLIFRGLKEYAPDIAGFQEVFNMEWAELIRERSGYPWLCVSGEHSGLIFLSKYPPVGQECLIMKTRSPLEEYRRYAFGAMFETPRGKVPCFNTHLSWQVSDEPARVGQVRELDEWVREKAGLSPAVVMGDFNTAPGTAPIHFLTSRGWSDTFEQANPWVRDFELSGGARQSPDGFSNSQRKGKAYLTWDYKNPYAEKERDKMAERRIDYIFVTRRDGPFSRIRSSRVVFDSPEGEVWPSDHFGVLTEFSNG